MIKRARLASIWRIATALLTIPLTTQYATATDGNPELVEQLKSAILSEQFTRKSWPIKSTSKVSMRLLELADAISKDFVSTEDISSKAADLNIPYSNNQVSVALTANNTTELSNLTSAVRQLGGKITSEFESTIFAEIPPEALDHLELIPSLDFAAPQSIHAPAEIRNPTSEGINVVGAERLHQAGVTGKGIKIGILDFGYLHYDDLMRQGTLPRPKAIKTFNNSGKFEGDDGEVHGTACAEIIHSMAPDAELYLATISGHSGQVIAAAQWLVTQGVDIISYSGGSAVGPKNGTYITDRLVDKLVSNSNGKLLWVNAAGNEGEWQWKGITVDTNGDGLIDIPNAQDNGMDLLVIQPLTKQLEIIIFWDDWGNDSNKPTSNLDIDAGLFVLDKKNNPKLVASSTYRQNGRGEPIEHIVVKNVAKGQEYRLALVSKKPNKNVPVHVYVKYGHILPAVASGSIGSPATAPLALAVGAVDVRNQKLEDFSSQGPTDDGRLKPEISAPDNTLSLAYQADKHSDRFPGTSAACPHVSGYSALLKQMQPDIGRDELIKRIIAYAVPMGEGRPNNQYGYGHISAKQINLAGSGSGTPPASGGNPPPPSAGSSSTAGRGDNRVFQPILDIMKQGGQ